MNRVSTFTSVAIGGLLIFALAGPAWAANQRAVSFGTTLPVTCFTGDLFFRTNAPAGSNIYACVAANTWVIQALATLGGDISGQPSSATVTQIQGHAVAPTAPQSGQSLMWNSSTNSWQPQTGSTTLGGDVTGPSGTNTVTQIQGRAVAPTAPQSGQALTWSSSTNSWQPQTGSTTLGGDVTGAAGTNSVTQIQGHAVAPTAPQSGQSLMWNSSTNSWQPQTGSTTLGGDVTGPSGTNTVTQIQGHAVAPTAPQSGQSLVWNSSTNSWQPQTVSGGSGSTTLGGDVTGPSGANTVTQIQGRAVAPTAPLGGQALTWNSSTNSWQPQTGSTTLGGDVVGAAGTNTVTQIQGHAVAPTAPQGGQSLTWNNSTNRWEPQTVSGGSTTLGGDVVGAAGANTVTQIQGHAVVSTIPTAGQALVWNGTTTRWEPQTLSTGGSGTGVVSLPVELGMCNTFGNAVQSGSYSVTGTWANQCNPIGALGGQPQYLLNSGANTDTLGYWYTLPSGVSGITAHVRGFPASSTANSLTYTASSGCISNGGVFNGGTQAAGTPVSVSSTVGNQRADFDLTVPLTGCNPGAMIYVQITRSGTYAGNYFWQDLTMDVTGTGGGSGGSGGGAISSVFGRTGAVVAANNDYGFSQISGTLALGQIAQGSASSGQCMVWNASTWTPGSCGSSGGGGGGGGGASMASQLGDLTVTSTSGAVLTIGPNCSVATPCNVRFGAQTYSLTTPVTATISGGTGNAYFYVASSGTLTVGHSMVVSCSGTCTAPPGITSFPTDSVPLFLWHATNGVWDASGSDQRAFLSSKNLLPGTGLMSTELSGQTTLGADPSVISLRASVPATSSTACTAGAWATDTNFYYLCVSQNSWRRAALSSW